MNRARRGLSTRQAAQGYVEYGLIVAVVGILAVLSLNVLSRAEQVYIGSLQGGLAPALPPTPSQPPNEPTAIATVNCDAALGICNAVVANTSSVHTFGPPRGTLNFQISAPSTIRSCTVDVDSPTPLFSATCSVPASVGTALQGGADVLVEYFPAPSSIATMHLKSPWTLCGSPYQCG
jgi:hypothetical protein